MTTKIGYGNDGAAIQIAAGKVVEKITDGMNAVSGEGLSTTRTHSLEVLEV